MSTPFTTLLYEPFHRQGLDFLQQHSAIVVADSLAEEDLMRQVADVDAVIVRANGSLTDRIMGAAPRLKVVGRHGAGVDNIDVEAATRRGIQVVNTPDAPTEGVAEHVVGMMLALAKQILRSDRALRQGRWNVRYEYLGFELQGRTLGVVGMGRIGYRVAQICQAIGMEILYHDAVANPRAEEQLGAQATELDQLLRASDIVTLHVPLTPQTDKLIGQRELALMKPTALLINAARGQVVDQGALVQALTTGQIGGAGLDVYEQEPLPDHHPLIELDNVILTPHMSSLTEDGQRRMSMVAEDVVRVLRGDEPRYPVNKIP